MDGDEKHKTWLNNENAKRNTNKYMQCLIDFIIIIISSQSGEEKRGGK